MNTDLTFPAQYTDSADSWASSRPVNQDLAAAGSVVLGGALALMRPDDVPAGPGRLAYRLGYGALSAALAGLMGAAASGSSDLDEQTQRTVDIGISAATGVVGAALFDPRVDANWWVDRALAKIGVDRPRVATAVLSAAATAGMISFERWADARFGDTGGITLEDEGDEEEVELTASQRAVIDALVVGDSANARSLRDQLAAARFFTYGGHSGYRVEAPAAGPRIVPHRQTHPVRGRFALADGSPGLISLDIEAGWLVGIDVGPDWDAVDVDYEWVPLATAADWPKLAVITVESDVR